MDPLTHEIVAPSDIDSILVKIPAALKSRLRAAGLKTDQKMSGIVRLAVERYLDDHGHVDALAKHEPAWKRVLDILWEHAEARTIEGQTEVVVTLSIKEIGVSAKVDGRTVQNAFKVLEERGDIWRKPRRGWGGRRTIVLKSEVSVSKVDDASVFGAPAEIVRPAAS